MQKSTNNSNKNNNKSTGARKKIRKNSKDIESY